MDSDEVHTSQQNASRLAEHDRAYEIQQKRNQLKPRVFMLERALRTFYSTSERLPVSVEELECRNYSGARMPCANELSAGTFYIDGAGQWAAVTPSVAARELRIDVAYGPD